MRRYSSRESLLVYDGMWGALCLVLLENGSQLVKKNDDTLTI